jgi:hypothetical protein
MILNESSFLTHEWLEFEERGKKHQGHNEFLLKNSEIEAIVIDETNSKLTNEFRLEVENLSNRLGIPIIINAKNVEQPIQEKKIKTKEELWKELVDLGYDSFDSLDDYESFNKSFGMKGTTEENLIQDIENSKAEEKDSFIDLTLNKIIKENNITKNC